MKTLRTTEQMRTLHPHLSFHGPDAAEHITRLTGAQRQRSVLIRHKGVLHRILFWSVEDHDYWRAARNYDYAVYYRSTL